MSERGKKGFRSTSVSRKAIRDTSSAPKRSPIPVLTYPLQLNFNEQTDTHNTVPQFMKVWRQQEKKTQKTVISRICLFGVLRRFQHCTGHITTGSWKGRGNQYIEFARVVYCKLPTNGKQLPAFPLTAMTGIDPRPQRWEARVLPLCHRGPCDL